MANRKPLAIGEWYHCYNRGVDKRKIFQSKTDYDRFLSLMYVANGTEAVHISNLPSQKLEDILQNPKINKGDPIVEIGAYALMPNHPHFAIKEITEGGIALYMQKLFTGYTMYFNKKYERTGALVSGTYKSKHVAGDRYMKWLVSYIHLNPVELFEPRWKEGVGDIKNITKMLKHFEYSSLADFNSKKRSARNILGNEVFELFDAFPSTQDMLRDAQLYHQEYQG